MCWCIFHVLTIIKYFTQVCCHRCFWDTVSTHKLDTNHTPLHSTMFSTISFHAIPYPHDKCYIPISVLSPSLVSLVQQFVAHELIFLPHWDVHMALEWLTGSTYYKFSNEHENPLDTPETVITMYLFTTCSMCQLTQEHPQGDIHTYLCTHEDTIICSIHTEIF